MKPNPARIGCRPTEDQLLLLRAACWTGEAAIASWRLWSARNDLERIDPESYRLLPLLHRNLRTLGEEPAGLTRLKGLWRRTWYHNQIAFHRLVTVLGILSDRGIKTMLLKGAALALRYYEDPGLRPMNDLDLAVPKEEAAAALRCLAASGWKAKSDWPELKVRISLYRHADHLEGPDRQLLDLHWQVMLESCRSEPDRSLWEGAIPLDLEGRQTLVLNPTDQLLHILVNGSRGARNAPLRWVADVMTILNGARTAIDWDRLMAMSIRLRLVLPVMNTLAYLRDFMGVAVPETVLPTLAGAPVGIADRLEYALISRHALWGRFTELWYRHSRLQDKPGLAHRFAGFPGFVRRAMGLRHLWQIPFYTRYRRKAVTVANGQ